MSEKTTSIQFSVLRNSMTKIGLGVCGILLIVTGILIGLFGRFYYEPHKTLVRLDGFSIALPFDPSVEEVTGMPPFSNRKLIKYQVVVSPKTEYQILVMQPNGLADKPVEETLDLKTADADTDLEQWAQSTIGVLCADEQSRAIKKDCLQRQPFDEVELDYAGRSACAGKFEPRKKRAHRAVTGNRHDR